MGCEKGYAVITGASSGIGKEFARRLAKEGYPLILIARRRRALELLAEELKTEYGNEIRILEADLCRMEQCFGVMKELEADRIAVFINNAGFGDCGYFPERNLEKELDMIDLNIRAVHVLTKLALEKMQSQKSGSILNVASSAGLMPAGPYMAAYYASKSYVASLTRAIAEELRQQKSAVYLGLLCPGPVDTEFNHRADVKFSLKGITAYRCANYAVDQMKNRRGVIIPTVSLKLAMTFGRFLPQRLYIRIAAHQQKKKIGI